MREETGAAVKRVLHDSYEATACALGAVLDAGLPGRPRLDAGLVGDEALAGHAQAAVRRALDLLVQLRTCVSMRIFGVRLRRHMAPSLISTLQPLIPDKYGIEDAASVKWAYVGGSTTQTEGRWRVW